ncbi:neuronal acetylcholine receptor subunit alpha-6-like [Lineus longissimus]|uniref:neuronal acetylcholine receptor subunit alpha-6-like n=1 Tax=Lineus longissimus TaxID=88925 RepID=UPI00315D5A73
MHRSYLLTAFVAFALILITVDAGVDVEENVDADVDVEENDDAGVDVEEDDDAGVDDKGDDDAGVDDKGDVDAGVDEEDESRDNKANVVSSTAFSNEERLINDLMAGYNKNVRPVVKPFEPVQLSLSFSVQQILEMDSRDQTITLTGTLTIVTNYKATIVSVGAHHSVWWNLQQVFKATCEMDMTRFPFDKQKCKLCFTGTNTFAELTKFSAVPYPNGPFYYPNTEWQLMDYNGYVEEVPFDYSVSLTYTAYYYEMTLKRRNLYYWIHLIAPCMIFSFLVTLVFVMPADAGEKISFSVTVLLAFTVYQLMIADDLPKGSTGISLMSRYLLALLALSAASVICSIFDLYIHHRDPKTPLPRFFRVFIFSCLGRILCKGKQTADQRKKVIVAPEQRGNIIMVHVNEYPLRPDNKTNNAVAYTNQESAIFQDNSMMAMAERAFKEMAQINENLKEVKAILKNSPSEEENAVDEVNEWKLASGILDRFFLVVFLIAAVMINIFCIFIA